MCPMHSDQCCPIVSSSRGRSARAPGDRDRAWPPQSRFWPARHLCGTSWTRSHGAARRPVGVKFHPLESLMHRARFLVLAAVALSSISILGQRPTVTVFEGARIIVGDGRAPIENGTFIVSGNRFTQVGRAADARVPAGAARVNLAGKTVMPTIIDTHPHLSQTRPW